MRLGCHDGSHENGIQKRIPVRDAFHFHYGRFVQFPDRDVLFASQDPIGNQGFLGNPNLDSQLTISYQALRAALADPIRSLRHE